MEPIIKYTAPVIEDITELTKDSNLNKFYANGFQCGMTLSDASIIFKHNNVNVGMVTLTLPAMKSLFLKMGEVMAGYEGATDQQILSFDELVILAQTKASDGK